MVNSSSIAWSDYNLEKSNSLIVASETVKNLLIWSINLIPRVLLTIQSARSDYWPRPSTVNIVTIASMEVAHTKWFIDHRRPRTRTTITCDLEGLTDRKKEKNKKKWTLSYSHGYVKSSVVAQGWKLRLNVRDPWYSVTIEDPNSFLPYDKYAIILYYLTTKWFKD